MISPAQKKALKAVTDDWKTAAELRQPQSSLMALAAKSLIKAADIDGTFQFKKV